MYGYRYIDIKEFQRKFRQEYANLYDHRDNVAGYREAVEEFDNYMAVDFGGFQRFVNEFVDYRKDIISSDREAAAFMLALERIGGLA